MESLLIDSAANTGFAANEAARMAAEAMRNRLDMTGVLGCCAPLRH